MCWALSRAGEEPGRIAAKLHTTVEAVEDAVKSFEAARVSVSSDIVDMVVNAEVLTAMNGVGDRIQSAMAAERFTGAYTGPAEDRVPLMQPDHTTALEAIRTAGELVSQVRPKGGGSVVNLGFQTNINGNGTSTVKTFEQRVREKRVVLAEGDVKFLGDGKGHQAVDGELMEEVEEDDDLDLDMDGTTDAEIEEADEVRD
jgi:hypothetical protein